MIALLLAAALAVPTDPAPVQAVARAEVTVRILRGTRVDPTATAPVAGAVIHAATVRVGETETPAQLIEFF